MCLWTILLPYSLIFHLLLWPAAWSVAVFPGAPWVSSHSGHFVTMCRINVKNWRNVVNSYLFVLPTLSISGSFSSPSNVAQKLTSFCDNEDWILICLVFGLKYWTYWLSESFSVRAEKDQMCIEMLCDRKAHSTTYDFLSPAETDMTFCLPLFHHILIYGVQD